ncbi:MAG: hypothetical protein IJI98_09120 [Methanosphaera sp.]|nr:hypothetical protein [Methanosphaera sp.]
MEEKNLIIICITAIICVAIIAGVILYINNSNQANNTTNNTTNNTINVTINDTNNTNNTTTTTKKTTTKNTKKNTDPDYDPERDASHKYATEDNPITVQQSDGEYTYYGPGHYDYYAGGNHMSGGYSTDQKERYS